MAKEISDKFKEPSQDNVNPGDFVIGINEQLYQCPMLYSIESADKRGVNFIDRHGVMTNKKYDCCVVLKKDGTYLVGDKIELFGR